jgi:hypothetical protein
MRRVALRAPRDPNDRIEGHPTAAIWSQPSLGAGNIDGMQTIAKELVSAQRAIQFYARR